MNIEIVTIGDELLIGQVVDTNSAWICKELNKHGFSVKNITTVGDDGDVIIDALQRANSRADVVLMTGGLGPTKDDITKKVLADYFDSELVLNSDVLEDVHKFLLKRGVKINTLNHNQALVPDKATVIRNAIGTAPILWFQNDRKVVVSMPGVPHEMKKTMSDSIIPRLKELFNAKKVIHKTLLLSNIPESELAEILEDLENNLPKNIKLAYLPSLGKIRLRLSAVVDNAVEVEQEMNAVISSINQLVGDKIYGCEDRTPAELLLELLQKEQRTISFAESSTGGLISHQLTALAGASQVFKGSVVAYDNCVKESVLGVSNTDIVQFGAVSKQVVEQMAKGVRKLMNTDYSIATSGIAGPSGGTAEKGVGTVWIAWDSDFGCESVCFEFGAQSREIILIRSAETALIKIIKDINKK